MITTQYDVACKSAIDELRLIDARLSVLDIFLSQSKQKIESNTLIGNELFNSGFAFRDITISKELDNLFMPTDFYSLNRINLTDEIELILSRESLFQVAQAYEILETYLYNQIADYIRLNEELILPKDLRITSRRFSDVRLALKRMQGRTNNRHLLGILRENNLIFQYHEVNNVYDLNFNDWIEMISEVRHSITHNRTQLNTYLQNELPETFDRYFKVKQLNGETYIHTSVQDCKELLHTLGGYIFFIYKAVTDGTFGTQTSFSVGHFMHDPCCNEST